MLLRKRRFKIKPQLIIFYIIGFIVSFSAALPAYVNSNYISQFTNVKFVGLFFIAANAVSLFLIFSFPSAIKKLGETKVLRLLLFFYSASLFFFSMANSNLSALLGIIFFTAFLNLTLIKLDVFIESFTSNVSTGRVRGIYLTICNLGWVAAPAISAYLITHFSYNFVYWLSGLIVIPTFILFLKKSQGLSVVVKYKEDGMMKSIKKMWKDINLRGIFFVAFILQLFYSAAIVYVPTYLHQNLNMSWTVLGPIFSFMLVPFILFQMPAGYLADKFFGEKEMLYLGLGIISLSLIVISYYNQPIAWVWALVLFVSRIGAALVEAMRESYFFKIVDAEDLAMINLFRLTKPAAYIIGPILAMIILGFLPINFIFFFFSIVVMGGAAFVWPIKDSL